MNKISSMIAAIIVIMLLGFVTVCIHITVANARTPYRVIRLLPDPPPIHIPPGISIEPEGEPAYGVIDVDGSLSLNILDPPTPPVLDRPPNQGPDVHRPPPQFEGD